MPGPAVAWTFSWAEQMLVDSSNSSFLNLAGGALFISHGRVPPKMGPTASRVVRSLPHMGIPSALVLALLQTSSVWQVAACVSMCRQPGSSSGRRFRLPYYFACLCSRRVATDLRKHSSHLSTAALRPAKPRREAAGSRSGLLTRKPTRRQRTCGRELCCDSGLLPV